MSNPNEKNIDKMLEYVNLFPEDVRQELILKTNQNKTQIIKDSGTMVQTIKFKPNSHIRFSVYMPDGKLFKTILLDYESPYKPNNRVQISALFSLKRLS